MPYLKKPIVLRGFRVLLKTAINPSTGYGIDGITLAQHLTELGADVHLEPLFVGVPIPPEVAYLFTKPRPEHFELALVHLDPKQLEAPPGLAKAADKVIGWSMWEFSSMSAEEWAPKLESQLKYFDSILVYDETSKQAFSEYVDPNELIVLQGGYDSKFWSPKPTDIERNWGGTFHFGMVGALGQRKNPFATIKAFNLLKEEHGDDFDAMLHLKDMGHALSPMMESVMPGIKIYHQNWPPSYLKDFYFKLNCLVAPSWGEGKNLPALEAQTTGIPVIASKCGGHMQWADPQWTYLIDGELAAHNNVHFSLRVDYKELAELMWHVYTHRDEARLKGQLASKYIPQQCDWQAVLEKFQFVVDDIKPKPRDF